jgi:hypothetical protein
MYVVDSKGIMGLLKNAFSGPPGRASGGRRFVAQAGAANIGSPTNPARCNKYAHTAARHVEHIKRQPVSVSAHIISDLSEKVLDRPWEYVGLGRGS